MKQLSLDLRHIEVVDVAQVAFETRPRLNIAPTLIYATKEQLRILLHNLTFIVGQYYVLLSLPDVAQRGMPGERWMHDEISKLFSQICNQQMMHAEILAKAYSKQVKTYQISVYSNLI